MEWIANPMPPELGDQERQIVEAVLREDGYRYSPIAYLGYRIGCMVAESGEKQSEALRQTLLPNGVSLTLQDAYASGSNLGKDPHATMWKRGTNPAVAEALRCIVHDAFGREYLGGALVDDDHHKWFGVQARRIYDIASKRRTPEGLLALAMGELALGATADAIRRLTDVFSNNLPFTNPPEAAVQSFFITVVNMSGRIGFYETLNQQVAQLAVEQWSEDAGIVRQLLRSTLQAQARTSDHAALSARDAMWGNVFTLLSAVQSGEGRHGNITKAFETARECCEKHPYVFPKAAQEFLLPLRPHSIAPAMKEPTQGDRNRARRALQEAGVTEEGIQVRAQELCGSVMYVFERPGRVPIYPLLWVLPKERQPFPDSLVYMPLGMTDAFLYPVLPKEQASGAAPVEWEKLGRFVVLAGHSIESDIYDMHQILRQRQQKKEG